MKSFSVRQTISQSWINSVLAAHCIVAHPWLWVIHSVSLVILPVSCELACCSFAPWCNVSASERPASEGKLSEVIFPPVLVHFNKDDGAKTISPELQPQLDVTVHVDAPSQKCNASVIWKTERLTFNSCWCHAVVFSFPSSELVQQLPHILTYCSLSLSEANC